MFNNKICVIKGSGKGYPSADDEFRPSVVYPEYLFKEDIASGYNYVYEMVRQGLNLYGLDKEHFNTSQWNPLKELVAPGDRVLIKPNLVLHRNLGGYGEDCLYTNPSLVAAVVDYVLIAQQGKGSIVIGDAPLQECDFKVLSSESGYDKLIRYYQNKGIDIKLVDFRNVKTYVKEGIHYSQTTEQVENGIIVQLNADSMFAQISRRRIKKLRITNYDPTILHQHHNGDKHEYKISKEVLQADVIINMPKPKTHRKAGVTASLKNLVGINANKEYLPHHTLGSRSEGGDAYELKNIWFNIANYLLDKRNKYNHQGKIRLAKFYLRLYRKVYNRGKKNTNEKYWEGSWHGNDTIWRTILDLNHIMYYADKEGNMTDFIQRKTLIIGDMIVSGEKEGPLEPSPIAAGVLVVGENPVVFDKTVCSIMGFDYHKIPLLNNKEMYEGRYAFTKCFEADIVSNWEEWDKKNFDYIQNHTYCEFEPTLGWEAQLGSPKKRHLLKTIQDNGSSVCVVGAGAKGIAMAQFLLDYKIDVRCFADNNVDKCSGNYWNGISCMLPSEIDTTLQCVVTVHKKYENEIIEQLKRLGILTYYVMN